MTTLAKAHLTVQDEEGNIVDGAQVTVTAESTGALAVVYADRDGTTPLGNPYTAVDGRDAGFYAVGAMYRIDFLKDDLSYSVRDFAVGTAAALDTPLGGLVTRTVTAAGDITVGPTDGCIEVNKASGAATNVNLGPAASRNGADIEIYDRKGDADTHNITPVFDGSETCMGLTGTSFAITNKYGRVKFSPLADGTGWRLNDNAL